jgi:hypothetical protein
MRSASRANSVPFRSLEERILSAVSQQILTIQTGLRQHADNITLIGTTRTPFYCPITHEVRRQIRPVESPHGHVRDYEPWLRWSLQLARFVFVLGVHDANQTCNFVVAQTI